MKKLLCLLIVFVSTFPVFSQIYSTGHRTVNYFDATRSRTVTTEIYYPADLTGTNVPVVAGTDQFPVVVFGHGFVINVTSYNWLADSLVKAGYIFAMPTTESGFSPSHGLFGGDLAFLCQRIISLNDSTGNFLYGRVRNRSAVGGHSMGGGCSVLAISGNNSVNALFNFAAAETNPSAVTAALSVTKPALIFSGSSDCIVNPSVQQSMYNNIPYTCKTYINVTDALHCQFANNNGTCVFGQLSSGCNTSSITPDILFKKIISVLIPFLDSYLKSSCLSAEFINSFNALNGVTATRTCVSEPACSVVALSLLSFTAVAGNSAVNLNWTTTPGTIDHFEIERSLNGTAFEKIRTVPAQSNRSNYSYVDPVFQRDVWYRLKVVLQDGSVNFSRVIVIKAGSSGSSFPNPFNDDLSVELMAGQSDKVFISMTDQMGRKVLQKTVPLSAGKNVLLLDSKALANGIYMLHIVNSNNEVLRNERVMKF